MNRLVIITGMSGSGKSLAASFWSERNATGRRDELRRRYSKILGDEKKTDEVMRGIGFLGQDDWVQIVPSGEGQWDVWPAERHFYMRTRGMLSRSLILSENEPIIENATADYGAAGDRESLGRCMHDFPQERLFYDPDWDNYYSDRDVHRISALVLLESDEDLDFAVRRLSPKQALEYIMRGQTPTGDWHPFYNDYTDVSGLLIGQGVVGDRLLTAYQAALKGDEAALMNGDEALGRVVLDRLKAQIEVWELFLKDVPVFVVNTIHGRDLTQDVSWHCSESTDFLKPGKEKSASEMRELLAQKFQIEYGDDGNWA